MKRNHIIAAVAVVAVVVVAVLAWSMMPSSTEKTVKFTTVAPRLQADGIAQGSIAGGVAWEPYCSQAIMSGNAHVLYWSNEIWPDHPCCVIIASNSFAQNNPDVVKAFLSELTCEPAIAEAMADPSDNYTLFGHGAKFSNVNDDTVRPR